MALSKCTEKVMWWFTFIVIVIVILIPILVLLFGVLYGTITNYYCYHNSDGIDFCTGYINKNVMVTNYQNQYDTSYYPNNCNCDTCVDNYNCDCSTVICSLIGTYNNGITNINCSVYDVVVENHSDIVENYYWSKSSLADYSIGSYHQFYITRDSSYKCYTEELIKEKGLQKYQFFVLLLTFASLFILLVGYQLLYCCLISIGLVNSVETNAANGVLVSTTAVNTTPIDICYVNNVDNVDNVDNV